MMHTPCTFRGLGRGEGVCVCWGEGGGTFHVFLKIMDSSNRYVLYIYSKSSLLIRFFKRASGSITWCILGYLYTTFFYGILYTCVPPCSCSDCYRDQHFPLRNTHGTHMTCTHTRALLRGVRSAECLKRKLETQA